MRWGRHCSFEHTWSSLTRPLRSHYTGIPVDATLLLLLALLMLLRRRQLLWRRRGEPCRRVSSRCRQLLDPGVQSPVQVPPGPDRDSRDSRDTRRLLLQHHPAAGEGALEWDCAVPCVSRAGPCRSFVRSGCRVRFSAGGMRAYPGELENGRDVVHKEWPRHLKLYAAYT